MKVKGQKFTGISAPRFVAGCADFGRLHCRDAKQQPSTAAAREMRLAWRVGGPL